MRTRFSSDLADTQYFATEQATSLVSTTLWGKERRLGQCDRGASARILARALCVPGASGDAVRSVEQAARVGIQSATKSWSGLTPGERDRKVRGWQTSRQREFPNADWGDDTKAAAEILRERVVRDLAALTVASARGNPAAQGEAARLTRNLSPASHRMNLGAALFIRSRLDALATDREAAGQPIPRCEVCGQFMARSGDGHQCPVAGVSAAGASGAVAGSEAAAEYVPPATLAEAWATLPPDVRIRLAERREYSGLGDMTRAEFVAGTLTDEDAVAVYFSRDDQWAVLCGETAYPVGRAEMLALARLGRSIIEASSGSHVRAARIACHFATPREVWHELVSHPHPLVRCGVASRRDVDADTLTTLYEAALANPDIEGKDEDEAAVMRFQQAGVRRLAVENKNASDLLLNIAANDSDEWVRGEAEQRLAVREAAAAQGGAQREVQLPGGRFSINLDPRAAENGYDPRNPGQAADMARLGLVRTIGVTTPDGRVYHVEWNADPHYEPVTVQVRSEDGQLRDYYIVSGKGCQLWMADKRLFPPRPCPLIRPDGGCVHQDAVAAVGVAGAVVNCPVCGRWMNPAMGCLHCDYLSSAPGSAGASEGVATTKAAPPASAKGLVGNITVADGIYDPSHADQLLRNFQAGPPLDEAEAHSLAVEVLNAYGAGPGRSWLLVEPQVVIVAGKRYVASVEHIWGGRLTRMIAPDGACYRYVDNFNPAYMERITTTPTSTSYIHQPLSAEFEMVVKEVRGMRQSQRGLERERLRLSEGPLHYFDDDYTNLMSQEELASAWFPLDEASPDTPILMTVREELELAALGTRPVQRELTVAEQSYLEACRERLRLGQQGWVARYQGWRMGREDGEQLRYQPHPDWSSAARERYEQDWLQYFADHWQPRIAEEGADSGTIAGAYAETCQEPEEAAAAAWALSTWLGKLAAAPAAARERAEESYLESYTASCRASWQARREEVSRELFAQAANRADQAAADDVAAGGYEDTDLSDAASDLWDKLGGDNLVKAFPSDWQQQIRAEFAAQHRDAYDERWQANWDSLMFEVEQEAEQQAMRAARSGGNAQQMASDGWQHSRFADTIRQPQRAAEAEALFTERFSQIFDENREQGAEDIDA